MSVTCKANWRCQMLLLAKLTPSASLFLVGLVAYWQAGRAELLGFDPLDAAFFPRLISATIMVLSMTEAARIVRQRAAFAARLEIPIHKILQALVSFGALMALCLSSYFEWVPFPFSGTLFVAVCGLAYMARYTPLNLGGLAILAFALPYGLDAVFQ